MLVMVRQLGIVIAAGAKELLRGSMWRYNDTLLSEELGFRCLLVFSVKKQQDLSLLEEVRARHSFLTNWAN